MVTNSLFTRDLVERLLPGSARRLVVLPMGVDPPRAARPDTVRSLRTRYRIGAGPVLLSVARLAPCKGHDVVIRSLRFLLRQFPDLTYLIVGDGPERPALQALAAEQGVGDRVVFCGRVPAGDLPEHFALGTLFVQLSRTTGEYDGLEGFGLSFLEAASHGLPAIGGRSGGVPEALQDGVTGCLVPPLDVDAFALHAAGLLSDESRRRRMSAAARAWAASHTWERSAVVLRSLWSRN